MESKHAYTQTILRIALGLLFIVPGIYKVTDVSGPTQMLSGIVLFSWAPTFWAWVLLLSEIIFGLSVLIGWKVRYTVWPLIIVLAVAALFVGLAGAATNWVNILFHLVGVAGLLHLWAGGAGALAVDKV